MAKSNGLSCRISVRSIFLLHESLGGGGTLSLMTDAQGKTFSTALLRMEIEYRAVTQN